MLQNELSVVISAQLFDQILEFMVPGSAKFTGPTFGRVI